MEIGTCFSKICYDKFSILRTAGGEMDNKIKELVELARKKFGLESYYLKRHSLNQKITLFQETVYTLTMEWFPNHVIEHEDEDYNPDGTAIIDIEIKSRKVESAIFVGGISLADGVRFRERNQIIGWIEEETGLTYGRHFILEKEGKGEFRFRGCIDGVSLYPSGQIELQHDKEGNLTFFTVYGSFPSTDLVSGETYSLSKDKVETLIKKQFKLIELPLYEEERLIHLYGIEEIFVRNDRVSTIPFNVDTCFYTVINKTIYWDESVRKPFKRKEINWIVDITEEQAFSDEPSPESFPITEEETEKCLEEVTAFLQQVFPNDSGKWKLKTLHRDKGYIYAVLREKEQKNQVWKRKLTILIDAQSLEVCNYIDNKPLLEMFDQFQTSDEAVMTKEDAYEKLKEKIVLTPCYVYDFIEGKFVLCGKLDCQFGVNASNGEILCLNDL